MPARQWVQVRASKSGVRTQTHWRTWTPGFKYVLDISKLSMLAFTDRCLHPLVCQDRGSNQGIPLYLGAETLDSGVDLCAAALTLQGVELGVQCRANKNIFDCSITYLNPDSVGPPGSPSSSLKVRGSNPNALAPLASRLQVCWRSIQAEHCSFFHFCSSTLRLTSIRVRTLVQSFFIQLWLSCSV